MEFPRDIFIQQLEGSTPEYRSAIIHYTDKLLANNLPVIYSLKHFAGIVGIEESELYKIMANIDGYYAFFTIKKKHGKKRRRIVVPYQNLKRIQRWILHEILDKVAVHPQCKGFVAGSSTLENAKPHVGMKYIRKFDFKDFFESINVKRVYGLFREIGYSPAVSHDLASLCTLKLSDYKYESMPCYRQRCFKDLHDKPMAVLAQGSPTSPAIANLICRTLDARFAKYADMNGINYTRYADDLTFSANSVEKLPKASFVRKVVEEEQLKLNFSKTGTYGRESRQSVTGILIDGDKPRVPQKFKRQIYRHLHFCEKFGPKVHFDHIMPNYANARKWLYGKILYVNAIEPDVAKDMLAKADALDWGVM